MKQTLLIIGLVFLFGCNSLFCQKKDSTAWTTPSSRVSNFIITGVNENYNYSTKYDTVQTLMLVCDTGKYYSQWFDDNNKQSAAYKSYIKNVWWLSGYAIREMEYTSIPCTHTGRSAAAVVCYGWATKEIKGYLDENKKPISKSLLIWLTK